MTLADELDSFADLVLRRCVDALRGHPSRFPAAAGALIELFGGPGVRLLQLAAGRLRRHERPRALNRRGDAGPYTRDANPYDFTKVPAGGWLSYMQRTSPRGYDAKKGAARAAAWRDLVSRLPEPEVWTMVGFLLGGSEDGPLFAVPFHLRIALSKAIRHLEEEARERDAFIAKRDRQGGSNG